LKIVLFCLIISTTLNAQDNLQRIKNLEEDFKSFDYEKVLQKGQFLLADAFTSKSDSLTIYTYMLNAAYALNDTTNAKNIIISILKTDINYTLAPQKTSPKIIEFFNYVKTQENLFPKKVDEKKIEPAKQSATKKSAWLSVSSILLPGSGHLIKDQSQKGYINTAISVGLISGIILSHKKTIENRDQYIDAKGSANFTSLYDDYNSSYKTRTLLIGTYFIWGLYNLFDFNNKEYPVSLGTIIGESSTNFIITYSF